MEKANVVLVVMNSEYLENTANNFNFDNINLVAIIADNAKKTFTVGKKQIPAFTFAHIQAPIKEFKDHCWLVSGEPNDFDDFHRLKKFLVASGLSAKNIFYLESSLQVSDTLLANLRYVEKNGADFFATGNEYMRDGLNLKFIPRIHADENANRGGVILSDDNQSLRQSYLIAKYVFEHVERGTIKFVLIGLMPDSFYCDNKEDLSRFQQLLNFTTPTVKEDLNFDKTKKVFNRKFSAKSIVDCKDKLPSLSTDAIEKNVQTLKEYIELCRDNDAQPVGVVFPFAVAARENYNKETLNNFRDIIHHLEENYEFFCVDMFDLNLDYDKFCDMTHLNAKGMGSASALLSLRLCEKNLILMENLYDMTYEYFDLLSYALPKDDYNALMGRVFEASAQLIRRKDKIKVGFVLRTSAEWCGDDLYNYFAHDERFETTIFLCSQSGASENELIRMDFLNGIEKLKSHNLNVVELENKNSNVPPQDIFIFLTPYLYVLPTAFYLTNITVKTLTIYITYGLGVSLFKELHNYPLINTAWKIFFPSYTELNDYIEGSITGIPRGLYSGYSRMDVFFKEKNKLVFNWKMARPDSKKIIYAPHWSINAGVKYATFQWNYQFMYEFAKAHPETSWVFKPHPNLLFSAVKEKVFPSIEAFEEYLQKWNDLPNAQVYTGAYYQAIFATSDGMIHDCGSFTAEYQYVDKPMIYLTRKGAVFNELGHIILNVSYLVDGKDFASIASLMQKIFIEGNDYKAAMRKEIFDKYLNYQKANGMLASEFIYKNILQEL